MPIAFCVGGRVLKSGFVETKKGNATSRSYDGGVREMAQKSLCDRLTPEPRRYHGWVPNAL